MQEPSFEQLAADAAAGLQADRELFLDVKQELYTHLEEKASSFTRQGKSEAESVELARKAFGSPLDVAAELLDANRRKMKLRSLLRITFDALIIPLAILLALYVGYGRYARMQAMQVFGGEPAAVKVPTLPFFGITYETSVKKNSIATLHGFPQDAVSIQHFWEVHRQEPAGRVYYATYALALTPQYESLYVTAMRQGEKNEPQNALYNILIAEFYLSRGILAQGEVGKHGEKVITDKVLDQRAFELGIAELQKAVQKPYLREYQMELRHYKLEELPPPLLTEDYTTQIAVLAAALFPTLKYHRALARKIPGCARVLINTGRLTTAEAVMDTWKPFSILLAGDADTVLIKYLNAQACAAILAKEGGSIYTLLGEKTKAEETRILSERILDLAKSWQKSKSWSKLSQAQMLQQHGALLASYLFPVFGNVGLDDLKKEELIPGRMHDHILAEEVTVQCVLFILALALSGTLIQGSIWLHRLRRSGAIPMLLMPSARTIIRALLLGIILPMLIYWIYSRLPFIGGREYGWASSMRPRFVIELMALGLLMLWLPVHLLRKSVRQRCEELSIEMPEKKDERTTSRIIRGGFIIAGILAAIALFTPGDVLPLLHVAAMLLAIGICLVGTYIAVKKRQHYGLYYGTLARSLAPVYAFAIILLVLTAQPWLLYNEIHWLQKDTLMYGSIAHSNDKNSGFTLVETRASTRLAAQLLQVLQSDTKESDIQSSIGVPPMKSTTPPVRSIGVPPMKSTFLPIKGKP